jgi:hypothetical protein
MKYSKHSPKFNLEDAETLWHSIACATSTGPRITMGNIHHMARQDDPSGYLSYRASLLHPRVRDLVRKGDRGLGELTAEAVKGFIKRTGGSSYYLFEEAEQAWLKCQDTKDLWITISKAIEEQLVDLEVYLTAQSRCVSEAGRDALEEERDHVRRAICYCRNHTGVRHILDFAEPLLHEAGFENKLDSVSHHLGVRNGVVDLSNGLLRARTPEDMLYTMVDVEYSPDIDSSKSLLQECALSAMADDHEMAAYLQKLLGYGITGDVFEEIFVVFTGSGRNSKGVLTQVLAKVMGSFYQEMNPAVIVDRPVSNLDSERGKLGGKAGGVQRAASWARSTPCQPWSSFTPTKTLLGRRCSCERRTSWLRCA